MITGLSVQNFKSWQDTGGLKLAPLTGLFGANNSGKTSILQVLLMLKQTVEHPGDWNKALYLGNERSLVNLGSYDEIRHQPSKTLELAISVSWKMPEKITIPSGYELDTVSFYSKFFLASVSSFNYQVGEHLFAIERCSESMSYKATTPDYTDSVKSLLRCYGTQEASTDVEIDFHYLAQAFENLFSRIHYLGPHREHPRPYYFWEGTHPKGVGQYGEQTIDTLLSDRIKLRPIDEQILKWLQQLELIDSYRLAPVPANRPDLVPSIGGNYEFFVKQYKGGPEVRLMDVGSGVSQVLPVLILCYSAPKDSILILEQPEAHLHPSTQSELADVLIDVIKHRNVQIILETHSAFMLHRLQRRIAEEQFSAKDTALHFCQINEGTSTIEQLEVDEHGNIRNWPQNFFGDDVGDLVEKTKAEMKRREGME